MDLERATMKLRTIALILLVIFSVYTIYTMAIAEQSLLSFGYQLISAPDTAQVVFDLYIMAFLAIVWIYKDSKRRSKPSWYFLPFMVLTLIFVSIGPLLYLVLRPESEGDLSTGSL